MAKKGKYVYDWPRPAITVDAVVFTFKNNKVKVLLIQRGKNPFKGKWAIPGGFVELNEELEEAVLRELHEETSLRNVPLEQLQAFGKVGRDPRGRTISITYMGITPQTNIRIKSGDDAAEVQWFEIDNIPPDLAFDHNQVLALAIKKLKTKKAYREQIKK